MSTAYPRVKILQNTYKPIQELNESLKLISSALSGYKNSSCTLEISLINNESDEDIYCWGFKMLTHHLVSQLTWARGPPCYYWWSRIELDENGC